MVGAGKSLLKVATRRSLELSKTGQGNEEFEDGNQTKENGPTSGSDLHEMSQIELWEAEAAMKETVVLEVGVSENIKSQPGNGVFPNVTSMDQILKCNFCDQAFFLQDLKSLQQHILELHYQGPKCSLCESLFASKDALKNHVRQRHVNEILTCEVCHMECQDLPFHMETFHKSEFLYKPEAKACSPPRSESTPIKIAAPVKLPRQKGAGVTRTCPECQKEISVDNFGRHVQEKHSKLRKSCPHCSKDFAPSNLQRHIRQVHFEERAQCPKCEKVVTACNLNTHIKNVHMKLKKVCQICKKEMPQYKISQHRRNVHNIGQPKEVVIPRVPNSKVRKTNSMQKMKGMQETKSMQKMKSMLKTKSAKKMVQQRQAKEDNTSMPVQEQVPVKMKCEETVVGDSTEVIKEEFLPEKGGGDQIDINGNSSRLEEGTSKGYQHEFEVFAGESDDVPVWWVEVDC